METFKEEFVESRFPIEIKEKAINKINCIVSGNPSLPFFRIAIKGGGCAGFSHEFTLELEKEEGDSVFFLNENKNSGVIVDPISLNYVIGSVFDFQETLTESKFLLSIPGSKGHCGCGQSFSL